MQNLFARLDSHGRQGLIQGLLSGLFWFAWAFGCYQTVYLQSVGFSASQLGLVNAVSSGVAIVSVAFWGMVSDRLGSLRRVFILLLGCTAVLYALVPRMPPLPLVLTAYVPAVNFFRGANSTFSENLLVRNCNELGLNYGMLRSMGSLLFTVGSLIISALLPAVGVGSTFLLAGLLSIPVLLFVLLAREPDARPRKKGEKQRLDPGELFRSRAYVMFLVFTFLFYIAASCEGNFVTYFMLEVGVDNHRYGVLLAYRALLEIPFLLLMVRLRRKFPLRVLVAAAPLLMALECLGFSLFARSLPTILLFATFFGLGNGLFIGSTLNYVYELAPASLKATAQAFYASVSSVAGILGNLLGGVLFDAIGAKTFYLLVAALYLLSAAVFVISFTSRTWR